MARSKPGVVWTEAGKLALASEKAHPPQFAGSDAEVAKAAKAVVAKHAARWKLGASKSDATGAAAIAYATKWKPGAKGTPAQLAGLISLAAASRESAEPAVIESLVRTHGDDVMMRVLVEAWSLRASYSDRRTWLTAVAADDPHVFDTSACCGKGELTAYLRVRHATGTPAVRASMKRAVDALWKSAPRHARPALAVATNDAKRAAQIARELLADDEPHAFFAWHQLPHVLVDAELVAAAIDKRDEPLSYRIVENLGLGALPLFEAVLVKSMSAQWRRRQFEMLANLKDPAVARILGEYAGEAGYHPVVHDYFAMHADLRERMLADPELRYYHDDIARCTSIASP